MPSGVDRPQLGPLSTALGEVLQFEVRGDPSRYNATELRSILEWEISPALRAVKGVTDVNAHGGYYKSFEIRPDPERLRTMNLTLDDIAKSVARNNMATGGGYIAPGWRSSRICDRLPGPWRWRREANALRGPWPA